MRHEKHYRAKVLEDADRLSREVDGIAASEQARHGLAIVPWVAPRNSGLAGRASRRLETRVKIIDRRGLLS